jgi:hypothetical protein
MGEKIEMENGDWKNRIGEAAGVVGQDVCLACVRRVGLRKQTERGQRAKEIPVGLGPRAAAAKGPSGPPGPPANTYE